MTRFLGEQKLIKRTEVGFPKGVKKITDNVYFILGYGGSTSTLIEGNESCVLIDTLNGREVAEEALVEIRKITDKPIKTIYLSSANELLGKGKNVKLVGATLDVDKKKE